MKKTLLALATTSAFIVSGSVLAAFSDAPKGEGAGANAQLEIKGTLINTDPKWLWQIPSATKAAVSGIALQRGAGVVSGENYEYSLTNDTLPVLEGYMKTPAERTGSGITPVITVNTQKVTSIGACTDAVGCKIQVNATHGDKTVGVLEMNMRTSGAYLVKNSIGAFYPEIGGGVTAGALALLSNQAGVGTTYAGAVENTGGGTDWANIENFTMAASFETPSASRLVQLQSAKLIVPRTAIPDVWSAAVPITITLK